MTTLTIHVHAVVGLLAVETYCGDDVKYVEPFDTWADLLATLAGHFDGYAYIEVKQDAPAADPTDAPGAAEFYAGFEPDCESTAAGIDDTFEDYPGQHITGPLTVGY